jgi:hypothetical protein
MSGKGQFVLRIDSSKYSDPTDFTVLFPNTITLDPSLGQWYIANSFMSFYNSIHNISSDFSNNKFLYTYSGNNREITLKNGKYSVDNIRDVIQSAMVDFGDYTVDGDGNKIYGFDMIPNFTTGKIDIRVRLGNVVKFNSSLCYGLADLLGYPYSALTSAVDAYTDYESTLTPQVNRGITSLYLECDMVSRSYVAGEEKQVLSNFTIDTPPYSLVKHEPYNLLYLPINKSKVSSIHFKLTDNLGRQIDLNGEAMSLEIKFIVF